MFEGCTNQTGLDHMHDIFYSALYEELAARRNLRSHLIEQLDQVSKQIGDLPQFTRDHEARFREALLRVDTLIESFMACAWAMMPLDVPEEDQARAVKAWMDAVCEEVVRDERQANGPFNQN